MNETMKTLLNRRSTRAYKPEQIKEAELSNILEGGKFAPSAINEQPWHFTVVQNKQLLNKINEACKAELIKSGHQVLADQAKKEDFSVFYNSPTLIIVSGNEKTITPQIDCALALGNMFLAAESIGIGSCWIHAIAGVLNSEDGAELRKELNIPQGHMVYCSGSFGYKAMEPEAPERKENTVSIIR
ncbi:MAG: nitroreductase [Clostridia bacterium]|jgi:nitroreductase|nr:nitroreductase [Clostridia bacterium]MDF2891252.1 nitroreductase [Clostridia bacterium]